MKFNVRRSLEKVLDNVPAIIEIAMTSVNAKPGELSQLIDAKIKKLLAKSKSKKKQMSRSQKKEKLYRELGKEEDAKVELAKYYTERFPNKEQQKTKHSFIQRLHDLEKIKYINRELDLEK